MRSLFQAILDEANRTRTKKVGKPPIELSENIVIIPIEDTEEEASDMLYGVDNNQ